MNFFVKYGIGIYLVITLLYKLNFLIPPSFISLFYYLMMVIGAMLILKQYGGKYILSFVGTFRYMFSVLFLNIIYFLVFKPSLAGAEYLFAKFATTNLIIYGVLSNYDYYEKVFFRYFKYIMAVMLIIGYFSSAGTDTMVGDGNRLGLGFNPNDLGLFAALGVLSVMIFNKTWYKSRVDVILFVVFSLLTLLSGSKAALLNVIIGTLLINGFNLRIVLFSMVFAVALFFTSVLNYTTSIDRLLSKEKAFETRFDVYEIGLQTFKDAFWTGHGLERYGWTDPIYWPTPDQAAGPHNAYLSIGIMYGVIFGSVFILLLLFQLIKALGVFLHKQPTFVKFAALIVILTIINGFFESLIVGVNEFITLLFWFAIGIISVAVKSKRLKFVYR